MSVTASAALCPSPTEHPAFARHRPEDTTLHQVVRENLQTLYAALPEQGTRLPDFVRDELEGYLACGLLTRGFALLRCDACRESQLVAFSCGGRGFCPSCGGRRMTETAANLVEHVLPAVPLRQWVLTLPFALRSRVAYDGELLGRVGRLFSDTLLGFYRRRMAHEGLGRGRSGVMNVVQRVASDMKLAPHFHALSLDGVYVESADAELSFHALPRLCADEVGDVLLTVRIRVAQGGQHRATVGTRSAPPPLREPPAGQAGLQRGGPPLRRRARILTARGHARRCARRRRARATHPIRAAPTARNRAPEAVARRARAHRAEEAVQRRHSRHRHGPAIGALAVVRRRSSAASPHRRLLGSPVVARQVALADRARTAGRRASAGKVAVGARHRRRSRAELLRRSFGHDATRCRCGGTLRPHAQAERRDDTRDLFQS